MTNRLMQQEFECIERILQERRTSAKTPAEASWTENYRDRAALRLLKALERQRETAWRRRRAKLDVEISELKTRIEKDTESSKKRSQDQQSETEMELRRFEQIYAEIQAPLSVPSSLRNIEQHISATNDEIVAMTREYQRIAEPFAEPMKKFDLSGFVRLGGDLASHDPQFGGKNPLNEDNVASIANAVEGFTGVLKAAFGVARGPERTGSSQVMASFIGLKLYKLVMHSDDLQNKRDDLISEYLNESATWEKLKMQSEIRKKRNELEAIPTITLPNVNLFTATNFPLKNPFIRQRRFLEDILAIWAPPKIDNFDSQNISERNQLEARIKRLRAERAAVAANPDLDAHERQMRLNMYDDKIEDELEKLRSFL